MMQRSGNPFEARYGKIANQPGYICQQKVRMKVIIPVFPNCVSASLIGMMDILHYAQNFHNQLYPLQQDRKIFTVQLMSAGEQNLVQNNGFPIQCHLNLSDVVQADIVILPAVVGDLAGMLQEYEPLIQWIKKQHDGGAAICSSCTGAFFVAATGLLDDKEATTSWFASGLFRQLFPKVKLHDEKLIVDNGHIVTGGATMSFMNLSIYLIEKYYGKVLGNYCAKMFLVDKGKDNQQQYAIFFTQKAHQDADILKAQEFIESNARAKITVSEVSEKMAMSERSFIRRFKSATGNTPSEYIQRVKVEHAKQLLEAGKDNIKEVSFSTGYEDLNYFRDVFKRYTGLTPQEYRRMFLFAGA